MVPHFPRQRMILHLDMDSFYASVEVQHQPGLAGKPVVIGADPKQGRGRGVVATCSYEARAFGVRSAMPVSHAFALCPHAVFLPPDFEKYTRASAGVMEILGSFGYPLEQVSIDEAFLDVSPLGNYDEARSLAGEIKTAVHRQLGLSCSIGIAPSKLVAKIASDVKKPDGLTVVEPAAIQAFLNPMPVRRIPGIGKKTETALFELGIRTIGELARHDIQVLIGRFGRGAVQLRQVSVGIDESEVIARDGMKSISREITFGTDTGSIDALLLAVDTLTEDVHTALAGEQLRFRTLTVKVRFQGFVTRTKSRSLPHYSRDPAVLRSHVHALFRDLYDGRKIRLVGIRVSSFEKPDVRQTTLPL
jgi:DNA polymerase IV (archaeal DinB-like DNA polymerase)